MWFEINSFKKLEYFQITDISYILSLSFWIYIAFIVRKAWSRTVIRDQENRRWKYKDPLGHDADFMQQFLYFLMYHSLGNTEQEVWELHFGCPSIVDSMS